MDFILTKQQRLVAKGAAKETSRPVLCCVHIKKGFAEVADGYLLVEKEIDYTGDEELLLEAAQIVKQKDDKLGKVYYSKVEGEGREVDKVRAVGKEEYTCQIRKGNFPETKKLYPTEDPVFQIALSRVLLLKLLSCLDKEEKTIKFSFYGKDKPVKFVCRNNKVKGLLMPFLIDKGEVW